MHLRSCGQIQLQSRGQLWLSSGLKWSKLLKLVKCNEECLFTRSKSGSAWCPTALDGDSVCLVQAKPLSGSWHLACCCLSQSLSISEAHILFAAPAQRGPHSLCMNPSLLNQKTSQASAKMTKRQGCARGTERCHGRMEKTQDRKSVV